MGSIAFLLNGLGPTYLTESSKPLLMELNVSCGIPQGSILGPLPFTIYFYDLPSCNLFSKPKMYADHTTLTSSAEDPYILEHKMSYDMKLIQLLAHSKQINS